MTISLHLVSSLRMSGAIPLGHILYHIRVLNILFLSSLAVYETFRLKYLMYKQTSYTTDILELLTAVFWG